MRCIACTIRDSMPPEQSAQFQARVLIVLGVIMLYGATRLALSLWTDDDGIWPRRRAVTQWLPICATVIAALALKQPAIAIGLIFGSSVACLSLVIGLGSCFGMLTDVPPNSRVWPMVLPVVLLILMMGFHGSFTWVHGAMLLGLGAAILGVWLEKPQADRLIPLGDPRPPKPTRGLLTIGACILAVAGGLLAVRGLPGSATRLLTPDIAAATVLSPLLLLPALGAATTVAHRGQMGNVITAVTGTVLLNLCLLLPLVIFVGAGRALLGHMAIDSAAAATTFPLIAWRVDTVLMVVLSFALVPIAAARWVPERFESMLLIGAYVAYLFVKMVFARVMSM
jgi:Ca2+/Na+ antiporter